MNEIDNPSDKSSLASATEDTRPIEDIVPGLRPRPTTPAEVEDRAREALMRRVVEGTRREEGTDCWLWRGAKNEKYGRMRGLRPFQHIQRR
jgi:hypothetical protein